MATPAKMLPVTEEIEWSPQTWSLTEDRAVIALQLLTSMMAGNAIDITYGEIEDIVSRSFVAADKFIEWSKK